LKSTWYILPSRPFLRVPNGRAFGELLGVLLVERRFLEGDRRFLEDERFLEGDRRFLEDELFLEGDRRFLEESFL
jgi:hypothetical protein